MKQGQWVSEWKRVRKDFESAMKKAEAGMVFTRVHESELKGVDAALAKSDKAFKEYGKCETTKQKRAVIKALSEGHDSYRKLRANHRKALTKIVSNKKSKENGSKDMVKAVGGLSEQSDRVDHSLSETILAMLNFVTATARSERKVEDISKSLHKVLVETNSFAKQAASSKTEQYYEENILEVGGELYEILRDIDKLVRKKKEIPKAKYPPKQYMVEAKHFTDASVVDIEGKDGEPDLKQMKRTLQVLTTLTKDLAKWRVRTWPK